MGCQEAGPRTMMQWRLHYNVDCDQEVDTYRTMAGHQFNEGKLDVKANILMWWKVHAVRFPYLSRLHGDILP